MAINRLKEVDIVDKALILQAVIAKAGGRIDRHHLQDLIFIAQETGRLPNIFVYDRDRTLGTFV